MATMREMVGTSLRPAEMYAEVARETAWQPGGFAKTKHYTASKIVELLAGDWSLANQVTAETLDRILAGVEEAEARGWSEADVERIAETG